MGEEIFIIVNFFLINAFLYDRITRIFFIYPGVKEKICSTK